MLVTRSDICFRPHGCDGGKHISYKNKEQVASLLFTELSTIQIKFMNVQYGSSDCAVAFATSLCEGIEPSTFKCREWFHDTCLVKAVPEQYWIVIDLHQSITSLLCAIALCL